MKFLRSNTQALTDEELLNKYLKLHKTELIGTLYNRYIHLVYGLCLKYLKSPEDAQDAVMNIFESLTVKLKNQEIKHFKSWLYAVSKNHCLMQLRKMDGREKINGEFMENALVVHPLNVDGEDNLDDNLEALEACLKELRKDQQVCVRLFYLKQKSYQEIVNQTAFKLGKVKSYIQNGKRNLKICLEKKHVKS